MSLTPQWLDELRTRITLSALIGRTVKVQRAGREFKACCPFHNEKTPSFTINDEKGFYHCFGCGAHGDAIRWMTDQRGLSFIDAVKELAASAGMDVPAADPRAAQRAETQASLRDVTEAAARWFTTELDGPDGAGARTYLQQRGIKADTVRAFGMGFAPDSRTRLREALPAVPVDQLVEAGLLIAIDDDKGRAKEPYDRFRGRVMIPIRDPRGRVIAFGGRILGAGEPKYLNSPDTPLFDKGRTLFNLDRAAPAARSKGRIVVVEGYMDVIVLAQAGIDEVVAPMGTALTEQQLSLLWKQSKTPILCFDGDPAGRKAAIRAADRAFPHLEPGCSLEFVTLPPGQDPDDVVRSGGASQFDVLIEQKIDISEAVYRWESEAVDTRIPTGRAALLNNLRTKADAVENQDVGYLFKKWFKDRFYSDYGWGSRELMVVQQSTLATSRTHAVDIFNVAVRSALYGASRFPAYAKPVIEQLDMLNVNTSKKIDPFGKMHNILSSWKNAIVEHVILTPERDSDAIEQILFTDKNGDLPEGIIKDDLRFPWIKSADSDAGGRLQLFVRFLATEQDLIAEYDDIMRRISADTELKDYDSLQRRMEVVRTKRLELVGSALDWMDVRAA